MLKTETEPTQIMSCEFRKSSDTTAIMEKIKCKQGKEIEKIHG